MIKQATSEQLLDDMAVRNTAKLCCDQALAKTIKKLLAKAPTSAMIDTDEPEFSHDEIERFSIIITTEQITKEICWQQHQASKKGTYL